MAAPPLSSAGTWRRGPGEHSCKVVAMAAAAITAKINIIHYCETPMAPRPRRTAARGHALESLRARAGGRARLDASGCRRVSCASPRLRDSQPPTATSRRWPARSRRVSTRWRASRACSCAPPRRSRRAVRRSGKAWVTERPFLLPARPWPHLVPAAVLLPPRSAHRDARTCREIGWEAAGQPGCAALFSMTRHLAPHRISAARRSPRTSPRRTARRLRTAMAWPLASLRASA